MINSGSDVVEVNTLFSSVGFLVVVDVVADVVVIDELVSSLTVAACDELMIVEVSVTGLFTDDKVA